MSWRWVEHTGEMELRIEAADEEEALADALAAFAELEGDDGGGEPRVRELEVSGADGAERIAAWLDELIFVAETEDFVPERIERIACEGEEIRAAVAGRTGRPAHLVKAVTHHRLEFSRDEGVVRARVVLDV